jgi:tmRNA-binding protein
MSVYANATEMSHHTHTQIWLAKGKKKSSKNKTLQAREIKEKQNQTKSSKAELLS